MDNDLYAITNIEGYASEMRQAAAYSLCSDSNNDNLDDYISLKQMINLVKNECIGFDDNDRPLLNEDANEKIYESTVTWIHNVGLAKLAAKDLVQCAWDDKTNEMIFWANPELNKQTTVKKKRKSNDESVKRRNKKKDS